MGSFHDDMAGPAAAGLIDHFAERDEAGAIQHAVITLPSGLVMLWPCSVGKLTQRYVAKETGDVVAREACDLYGETTELATGAAALPQATAVLVLKHGGPPFQVDPELSEYGGPVTKLALLRAPFVRLGNLHDEPLG